MKKIFGLSFLAILISLATTAQISKGSILLGGQAFYANSNVDWGTTQPDQKNKNGSISISAGKAIKENSVVGVNVAYNRSKGEDNYNGNALINSKVNQYKLGIFYRQYKKLAKDFYFFAEMEAAYLASNQTNIDNVGTNEFTNKQSGGQLSLTPGISYKILKKLQLEILIPSIVSVNYNVTKSNSQTTNYKQNQFAFNTNLNGSAFNNLGVGFRFVLE